MVLKSYDETLAAMVLWREARGVTPIQRTGAYRGIWWVIQNRMADASDRWPDSMRDVILQPWQFSSFNYIYVADGGSKKMTCDPNAIKWPMVKHAADWVAFTEACAIVNSPGPDPTGGANHYHDTSIDPPYKAWLGPQATAEQLEAKATARIGPLRFYRL